MTWMESEYIKTVMFSCLTFSTHQSTLIDHQNHKSSSQSHHTTLSSSQQPQINFHNNLSIDQPTSNNHQHALRTPRSQHHCRSHGSIRSRIRAVRKAHVNWFSPHINRLHQRRLLNIHWPQSLIHNVVKQRQVDDEPHDGQGQDEAELPARRCRQLVRRRRAG
ncbi:hypothetical protein BDY17DRAFT_301852 [Neohortaea acidophila]|uniref:Uncharacterized protein n=1 Tax=Neohortaea acidophila TaxID=245834 RepID=A0A6A6PKE9_9PEZI|nr:uncharacterized protein BDY17DRAFT_301852 [Neohortaea acidophila]KAF2480482.1 hypothetical protein BDY17DRAFT_301852 [Neohortaea acidophila]